MTAFIKPHPPVKAKDLRPAPPGSGGDDCNCSDGGHGGGFLVEAGAGLRLPQVKQVEWVSGRVGVLASVCAR